MWGSECEISGQQLLQCVVEVAQAAFRAEASSVFLIDEETGELVFEAVSGQGEEHLVGTRFPAGTGIAGWVAACGQPMLADDLDESDQFSGEAAESTGYVPRTVAAAPLFRAGECIGVLEVLDRAQEDEEELRTLELLGLLASQAAMGLELLQRLRLSNRQAAAASAVSSGAAANTEAINRISAGLQHLNPDESRLLSQVLELAGGLADTASNRAGRGR
ncbi:GAF domain-containing protein [Streptacidiphilus sp. N1-12]|uniref:GAF domain-containing protein n=2 Tax=Streptacidiphilus alkalitolerans TaxID=3342712 RepID=A0ABV6WGD3_9ACTN